MKLFFISLFVALSAGVFAQANYHKAYFVKLNGDTVRGFIDYREWPITPDKFDFKADLSDKEPQQIGPANCRGFGIDNMASYTSYTGPMSMDRNRFPDLPEKLDTAKVQTSIFMKPLVAGKYLSLYEQTDNDKARYFVAEVNSTPVELIYNYYFNERHEAIERSFFRGQLIIYATKYAPGNSELIKQANTTIFDQPQLKDIIYKINGDTSVVAITKTQRNVNPSRWFIGIGVASVKNNDQTGYFIGSSYVSPNITFGFDHFNNPDVQQWVYRTSFSLSMISGNTNSSGNSQSFTQLNLSVAGQILYNLYNKDNFKWYLGAGIAVGLSNNGTQALSNSFANAFGFNLPLQTGVTINRRLDVALIFSPNIKVTPDTYNQWSNRSIGLGLKIFLDN